MIGRKDLPELAIGHAGLASRDAQATAKFLAEIGARVVFEQPHFAIVELRGGTHVVIRSTEVPPRGASFDLMVDDIGTLRTQLEGRGLHPSDLRKGGVHNSFDVEVPGGVTITFTSSHVMGRV